MKKLKDQKFILYNIKITQIREVLSSGRNKEFKTKMYCANIRNNYGGGMGFCKPTLKQLLNGIKEELN